MLKWRERGKENAMQKQCVTRVYFLQDIKRAVRGFHGALLDSNKAFVSPERKDPFTLLKQLFLFNFPRLYENIKLLEKLKG